MYHKVQVGKSDEGNRTEVGRRIRKILTVISGFGRKGDEMCALLGYRAASSDNPLPKFRDNISAPSSMVKKSIWAS
jgi:hypothetical protein